jgi:hypothetical protein
MSGHDYVHPELADSNGVGDVFFRSGEDYQKDAPDQTHQQDFQRQDTFDEFQPEPMYIQVIIDGVCRLYLTYNDVYTDGFRDGYRQGRDDGVNKTLDALEQTESGVVPRRNSAPASDTHNQEFDPSKYPVHAEHVENVSAQENDNMQEVQESPMVHEESQRESVAMLEAEFEALLTEVKERCDKLEDKMRKMGKTRA